MPDFTLIITLADTGRYNSREDAEEAAKEWADDAAASEDAVVVEYKVKDVNE